MFRVTRAEEQAIRLTMCLGALARQATLAELAENEKLPEPMVAKLLGMLRRGGVVEALRGRNGGYVLAGKPADMTIAQVVQAVGNDTSFGYPCRDQTTADECDRTENCGLRPVWQLLENRVNDVLRQTTIADLLLREESASRSRTATWPLHRD